MDDDKTSYSRKMGDDKTSCFLKMGDDKTSIKTNQSTDNNFTIFLPYKERLFFNSFSITLGKFLPTT